MVTSIGPYRLLAGTSGYSYKAWKGAFYPAKLASTRFLNHYAEHLPTVEINNTFYRFPREDLLKKWSEQVPEHFRFVLKAPRRITHERRLHDVDEALTHFVKTAQALDTKLGGLLFQLPPTLRCDLDALTSLLKLLPGHIPCAFEFRHTSWFEDSTFAALRDAGAVLCLADVDDDATSATLEATSNTWGYLRLRKQAYSDDDLRRWITWSRAQRWQETYVFFKHEDDATGPALATRMLALASEMNTDRS